MKNGDSQIIPKIKQLAREMVGAAARGATNDKETMEYVVGKIYAFLPGPLRLMFSESELLEFCWEHKNAIFGDEINQAIHHSENAFVYYENQDDELSEREIKYLEDVRFMLEDDGTIDEAERRILDNKLKEFGISDERARKIELSATLKQDFTPDEKNYASKIKNFLHKGRIDKRAREILEKRRERYNISEQRAVEIENYCRKTK